MTVFIPLSISVCCYSWIAVNNLRQGDYPHALAWFSYTMSQIAFLWYEYQKLSGTNLTH